MGSNGDPVRIEANVVPTKGKGKKKADEDDGAVEGVVYRVSLDSLYIVDSRADGHRYSRRK